MLVLFCIYFYLCGGEHIENITTILGNYFCIVPDAMIPSSDTKVRGVKELRS
jgi:hypothetical protein